MGLKIGRHKRILVFHEIKFQRPEIKDRQVASKICDIWRERFVATIGLCLMDCKYSFTRSLAFDKGTTLSCNCELQDKPHMAFAWLSCSCILFFRILFVCSEIYFTDLLEELFCSCNG